MAVFIILVGIFSLLCAAWWLSQPKNLPPGPPRWPIVGSLPHLERQIHLMAVRFQKTYGDVFCFGLGTKLNVVLNDFHTVKKILSDDATTGRDQDTLAVDVQKMGDTVYGVIISVGELWKEHRRFALSTLRDFGMGKTWLEDAILEEVDDLCSHIRRHNQEPLNPKTLFSCSVANVISALIFGKRFSPDDPRFARLATLTSEAVQDIEAIAHIDAIRWLRYLPGKGQQVYNKVIREQQILADFLEELVREHECNPAKESVKDSFIAAYQAEANRRKDDQHNTFTRFQLISTLMDLFAAGSETTSTTLLHAMSYMMLNPDVYRKVKEEIRKVVSQDDPVRMSDRANLPYTEATLMEVQRVATLVPLNAPHETLRDMQINGYNIPKGSSILTNIYFIHRDPRYWKNPDAFDPTRFLDQEGKVFRPDGFMPFSVGKRACLGESLAKMEMWLFFANLLHRFDIQSVPGEQYTYDCDFAFILSPKPFKVLFK